MGGSSSDANGSDRTGQGIMRTRASGDGFGLYAVAIFASAFLIFLVQPMVGKRILPWFGGVPAVWTLCLAFYQSSLFLGYAYAHLMIRFVSRRFQPWIHATLVLIALALLPVLPEASDPVSGNRSPSIEVLSLLTGSVALPFLVLAATGPLVQAWFARAHPGRSPYPLYAVSNFGSLLALFVYPLALEPHFSLSATGTLLGYGFGATGLAVLACSLPGGRRGATIEAAGRPEPVQARSPIGAVDGSLWLLLSGAAVVLLMGVSNKLCLDVASVPLLWIVPLATYLITFILCFSSERAYRRMPFAIAAIVALALIPELGNDSPILFQTTVYCALLFSACMLLHGELYRLRPAASRLTAFYLCVSAGGAIGGLLVGIAAPIAFDDYHELPLGLMLGGLLILTLWARDPESLLGANGPRWRWAMAAPLVLSLLGYLAWREAGPDPQQIHRERSFFGVLTVFDDDSSGSAKRSLANGTTVHGTQFQGPSTRRLPTAYFGRATGIGLLLSSRPPRTETSIGVIGLGVGTLAAYGREGDSMRFYEIDPVVVRIARDDGSFSFLDDSEADVTVVEGDARLAIVDEQKRRVPQRFDVLVLDAFSSDAIPVHLMTREAFEHYFRALSSEGVIAVHVTNRHFQLTKVVARVAAEFAGHSLEIKSRTVPELQSARSDWVVVARDPARLEQLSMRIAERHRALRLPRDTLSIRRDAEIDLAAFPVWTDDYSDLLGALGRASEATW